MSRFNGGQGILKKILVPVDGSDSSLLAEETAVVVAKKLGAAVTVLYVRREIEEYHSMRYAAQGLQQGLPRKVILEIIKNSERQAKKAVRDARSLFIKEGVRVETKILSGIDPADSILEFSKKNFELIIMGARGKNEKDPHALGSVTKKVIRHATCPTLFTKKACSLSNLLVCLDGSERSIKALDYVVMLAERIGSKITLLNVQEYQFHYLHKYARIICEKLGKSILSNASTTIGRRGVKVNKKVAFGVPSDIIVEIAERRNHDLIVLGSRGLGSVKRFLLGSVSDDVSHKAKCSVLIHPAKHE